MSIRWTNLLGVIVAPQLGYFISTTGLSTYTSEERFPPNLHYDKKELWKLQTVEEGSEGSEIPIKYPTEMELSPIRESIYHFGIKPAKNKRVRPETFLQVTTL